MKSFRQYFYENTPLEGEGITFIDVDETLFHTKAHVKVMKGDEVIKKLNNQEFNTYKLQSGESFDFSEFKDAEFFRKTSIPIEPVLKRVNRILNNIERGGRKSKVVILTARSRFDDMQEFKQTFRDHGVRIDELEIVTVGDAPGLAAEKKKEVVYNYLSNHPYKRVRMFDDSLANLKAFQSLEKEFPETKFFAVHVDNKGNVHQLP